MERFTPVVIFKESSYSIDCDQETGGLVVALPVSNGLVEYEEYYQMTPELESEVRAVLKRLDEYTTACIRRESDDRLLLPPGEKRGAAYADTVNSLPPDNLNKA